MTSSSRLSFLLFLVLTLPFQNRAFGDDGGGTVYRISGVVLSSRDDSPVARCRISADAVSSDLVSSRNRSGRGLQRPDSGRSAGGLALRAGRPGRAGSGVAGVPQDKDTTTLTDSEGRFSITVPHAGMWRLTGTARGFHSQAYDEHEGYSSAIVLTSAAPQTTLSFRINPDAAISGLIFDEAGEPVRQAQVRVELVTPSTPNRPPGLQIAGFAQTDDRGHYEVTGLAKGSYRLGVEARPWYATGAGGRGIRTSGSASENARASSLDPSLDVVYPSTWFPAALNPESAEILQLQPGEERQADVHLTPVPAVHLRVPRDDTRAEEGDQPRGFRVPMISAVSSFGTFLAPAQVNTSAGEWDIGGLAPGNYQVRLPGASDRLVQLKIAPGSATVVGLEGATPSIKVSTRVTGVPDRSVERVLLTDVESGQVFTSNPRWEGRSQRSTGADDEKDDPISETTRTISVPPHRYEVSLSGADGVFLSEMQATGAQVSGSQVEITGADPILTLRAATGRAELTGLVHAGDKPVVGAMVLLVPITFGQAGGQAEVSRDQTNTDGSFVLSNLIPGQYILVAIDHGWNVNWHDPATLARYLAAGSPVQLAPSAHQRRDIEAAAP